MVKILMIAPGKGKPFVEARRKEIYEYSKILKADVITTAPMKKFFVREHNYYLFKNKKLPFLFLVLFTIFKQRKYDVIFVETHAHHSVGFVFNLLIFLRIINPRKTIHRFYIGWMRELRKSGLQGFYWNFFTRFIIKKIRGIICLDNESKEYIDRQYKVPSKVILGTTIVQPKKNVKRSKTFKLIFASAPTKTEGITSKGIPLLIEAAKIMKRRGLKNIEFDLYWRWGDDKTVSRLIQENKVEDYLRIIKDSLNIGQMHKRIKEASGVLFIPKDMKRTRNYPTSVLESLGLGRPVIIAEYLEMSPIVKVEGCGLTVMPSPVRMANAVKELRDNYASYQRSTTKTFNKYFNLRRNIKQLGEWLHV